MAGENHIKYRKELKYVCTEQELQLIEARVKGICRPDIHAGTDGNYRIRSVYFDDVHDTCFYENENGTDPREKFRIRIYNGSSEKITLECKRKEQELNHKFSCPLTKEQCQRILDGSFPWSAMDELSLSQEQEQLLSKFYLQYHMRLLRPKVIVEYVRTPYIYSPGNVRITFDRNISGSGQVRSFMDSSIPVRPVMPVGLHVLEVKYDELLPDYLYNKIQIKDLSQTAYSKYYLCRKFHL